MVMQNANGLLKYVAILALSVGLLAVSVASLIFWPKDETYILQTTPPQDTTFEEVEAGVSSHLVLSPPYIVNVRVIVEADEDGNPVRDPEDIKRDFDKAAEFYAPILMTFHISEAKTVKVDPESLPSSRDYRNNANLNSNAMSVFYVYGHPWLTPKGTSAFPWSEDEPNGIIINGKTADHFTLAHEIGHYFGLYHTFKEGNRHDDHVPDTMNEDEWTDKMAKPYAAYNNLMNYSGADTVHLTLGQLERVRFYAVTLRSHQLLSSEYLENQLQPDPVSGRHHIYESNILLLPESGTQEQ